MGLAERDDYRAAEAIGVGIAALLVLGSIMVYISLLSRSQPVPDIALFSLPSVHSSIPLFPTIHASGEIAFAPWIVQVLSGVLYIVIVTGYYLCFGGVVIGLLLIGIGIAFAEDLTKVGAGLKRKVLDGRVQMSCLLYAGFWFLLFNPRILDLAIEVLIILTVGGVVFLFTASSWLTVYDRTGPLATVLVVYPLGALMVLLPPIAAALASPTFRRFVQEGTSMMAIWLLDNVFAYVGLDTLLRRSFDLQGVGYIAAWVAVITVLGWLVGVVARVVDWPASARPQQ